MSYARQTADFLPDVGRGVLLDQCQPQYLVQIDRETLAVITDDRGYAGNASTSPTVPPRPAADIAQLVMCLQDALARIELQPGGPPLIQG